jgi:hypothetical protein
LLELQKDIPSGRIKPQKELSCRKIREMNHFLIMKPHGQKCVEEKKG